MEKAYRLEGRAEANVLVQTAVSGSVSVQNYEGLYQAKAVTVANGEADIVALVLFTIRIMNPSTISRYLPKGMVVAHAMTHPTAVVALTKPTDQLSTTPEPATSSVTTDEIPSELESQLEPEVQLNEVDPELRQPIWNMLKKHRELWS